MANKRKSEAAVLEQYRVAFENAQAQSAISATLAEFGYDATTIASGQALLTAATDAYNLNKTEDDETTAAYAAFTNKKDEVAATYSLHRKKAKVLFRKDALTADKLMITGSLSQTYIKWLENVKKFYAVATVDTAIQTKLATLKVSAEDLTAANTAVTELESARATYLREKGESQDATKAKDAAMSQLEDWMVEFYAVARIALEDNPQLLEALGLLVRS